MVANLSHENGEDAAGLPVARASVGRQSRRRPGGTFVAIRHRGILRITSKEIFCFDLRYVFYGAIVCLWTVLGTDAEPC